MKPAPLQLVQPGTKECSKCGIPKSGNAFFMNSAVCLHCVQQAVDPKEEPLAFSGYSKPVDSTPAQSDIEIEKLSAAYARLIEKEKQPIPVPTETPKPFLTAHHESKESRRDNGELLKMARSEKLANCPTAWVAEALGIKLHDLTNAEFQCSNSLFEKRLAQYEQLSVAIAENRVAVPNGRRFNRRGKIAASSVVTKALLPTKTAAPPPKYPEMVQEPAEVPQKILPAVKPESVIPESTTQTAQVAGIQIKAPADVWMKLCLKYVPQEKIAFELLTHLTELTVSE